MQTNFDIPTGVPPAPPVSNQTKRSRFWPGFAIGLLLMAMLTCGGTATVLGLDRISLADIQGSDPLWTPPAVTPTPQPAANVSEETAGESVTEGSFQPGAVVRNVTNSRVNIRATPGHLGKPAEDVLAQAQPGESMEIIGGPEQADNLTWWRIRHAAADGRTVEGWMAEATSSGVVILGP
jgi:hypothetical protein